MAPESDERRQRGVEMREEEVEVLLVEDNPSDQELTLRALRQEGLANQVHVVNDGEEALDFIFCRGAYANGATDRTPKLVFLDLKLPKSMGCRCCEKSSATRGRRASLWSC